MMSPNKVEFEEVVRTYNYEQKNMYVITKLYTE